MKRPDGQTALPAFRLGGVPPEDAVAAEQAARAVIAAAIGAVGG